MRRLLSLAVIAGVLALTPALPGAGEPGEIEIRTPTLPSVAEIDAQLGAPGVREVEVRGLALAPDEVRAAFLNPDPDANILVQVAPRLGPGQRVDFRTATGERFRVQNEDGELRVRVRDARVEDRAALATFLSANGFGRVEIRGRDAAGNRVRLEVRDGVVKKDEVRADRSGRGREGTSATINNEQATDRGRDLDHGIRGRDRAALERARHEDDNGRIEQPDRIERSGRPERMERGQRLERVERVERSGSNSGRR